MRHRYVIQEIAKNPKMKLNKKKITDKQIYGYNSVTMIKRETN